MNSKCHFRCVDPSRKRDFKTVIQGTHQSLSTAWFNTSSGSRHLLPGRLQVWWLLLALRLQISSLSTVLSSQTWSCWQRQGVDAWTPIIVLLNKGNICMMTARPRVSLTLHRCIKLQLNLFGKCSVVLQFPLVPVAKRAQWALCHQQTELSSTALLVFCWLSGQQSS